MNENIQQKVELLRGYRDSEGNVHKTVVLRPALIDDEIKRDGILAAIAMDDNPAIAGQAESPAFATLLLIQQVTIKFGEFVKPPDVNVFRSLSRHDAQLLMAGFYLAEEKLNALYAPKEESEGNDEGADEKGESPSSND